MQVFIRRPFSVHLEKTIETEQPNGNKTRERVSVPNFSNSEKTPIDLKPEEVLIHLHKLEPVDAEAKKFFADYHAEKEAARATTQPAAGPSSHELVATAVVNALVNAGLVGTPAKADPSKGAGK